MGTLNNPGAFDCLASLDPDEPYFLLKGRDPHAADLVRRWAIERLVLVEAGLRPDDRDKVKEALACADAMDAYRFSRGEAVEPGKTVMPEGQGTLVLHDVQAVVIDHIIGGKKP